MRNIFLLITVILVFFCSPCLAQKVLQIEKYGSPRTKKLFIGQKIEYKLKSGDDWHRDYIEDLLVERKLIALSDRYLKLDDIEAFRYERPLATAAGKSLFWFGLGWSGFAAIGTATDGDPDTRYRWSDAAVTGASLGLAYLIPKTFRYKKEKFGKRKRLRILDLTIH
jgi:hypothetical protein